MIKALASKRNVEREMEIFETVWPAIKAAIKAGGGADAVLKKSETVAAVKLIQHANSEDASTSLKASIEILNRVSGKPVERSINVYGDIAKMNESDVDNQIMMLLQKTGATKLIHQTLDVTPPKKKTLKQKRKAQKLETTIDAEVTVRPGSASSESQEPQP